MNWTKPKIANYPGFDVLYALARGARNAVFFKRGKDAWGFCNICGHYTCFRFHELLAADSALVRSCGWDGEFLDVINACNTLDCSWCMSKFRVRCATQLVLDHLGAGRFKSLRVFVRYLQKDRSDWKILETGSTGGVFSNYSDLVQLEQSEYFSDVPRGTYRGRIRSEDLQALTFADRTFDVVLSLDVFEHIADPWRAFAEVKRVLKPGGIGIFTFPIDCRQKNTRQRADFRTGQVTHLLPPAFHLDPLRAEGTLVFWEFGLDIAELLVAKGFSAELRAFSSPNGASKQYLLILRPS